MKPSLPKQTQASEDCINCSAKMFCLPVGLNTSNIEKLEHLVKHKHVLHKNEVLFESDQPLSKIYVVRSGSFKTYYSQKQEHITNFYLPGEMLGFDAIPTEKHTISAKALETSSICEISFKELFSLSSSMPALQKRLLNLACQQQGKVNLFSLNSSAITRLSAFLLDLSQRFKRQGLQENKFHLSMSRQDIANYLGLTNETTSRMFTQLTKENVISIQSRYIELINKAHLKSLALE